MTGPKPQAPEVRPPTDEEMHTKSILVTPAEYGELLSLRRAKAPERECPACGGEGRWPPDVPVYDSRCDQCDGTGKLPPEPEGPTDAGLVHKLNGLAPAVQNIHMPVTADAMRLAATRIEQLGGEVERLRAALDEYGHHVKGECRLAHWEAGKPTGNGGYRTKFDGKWYAQGKWPACECGLHAALRARVAELERSEPEQQRPSPDDGTG